MIDGRAPCRSPPSHHFRAPPSGTSLTEPAQDHVGDRVVAFVHTLDAGTLPVAVRDECVRALTHAVGCIVGGSRHETIAIAQAALAEFGGAPVASVLGRGRRTDALQAALMNGTASAAYSYFDTYSDALLHPAGPIVAGLLACAERTPVGGSEVLSAFAAGMEIACRLTDAIAVPPAEGEMGWSQTGVVCGPATALAVGRLLRLTPGQLRWALGISVSEAAGSRVSHGSMSAALIFGQAARSGLQSALLAARGFTGAEDALAARYGFGALFARRAHLAALTASLGERFALLGNTYKPYPCGIVIHAAIDAMLRARRALDLPDSGTIEQLLLTVSPGARSLGFRPDPRDDLEAKFSLQHWVAAAAAFGKAGFAEGALAVVHDPEIRRLRAATVVAADPALPNDAARLTVRLKSGASFDQHVEHCVGSLEAPLTDADLETKFLDQVALAIGDSRAQRLHAACMQLEGLPDAGEIARLGC